jgi:hypothetical protein
VRKVRKRLADGPTPGDPNMTAIAKVGICLVIFTTAWYVYGEPFAITQAWWEYGQDVSGFMENNTTWWNLSRSGRVFYVVFPFPWLVGAMVWREAVFRQHRKRLVINGGGEGMVMWVYGGPRQGHIYDLWCILNGFKHMPWRSVPRPITGDYGADNARFVTIYYRQAMLWNPMSWLRMVVPAENVRWGVRTLWVSGKYRTLVRHPANPVLNFDLLTDENPYETRGVDLKAFVRAHRATQDTIMKDNYRMTVSEPGVSKLLVRSSMMALPDDVRDSYINLMPEERLNQMLEEYYARERQGREQDR